MRICVMGGCGHSHMAVKKGVELVGVCLTKQETPGFSFLINRFGKVPVFDTYEEMLEQCKPDMVVVDGLFGDHARMAAYALERGIHVYCEKPVAIDREQLSMLKAACEKSAAKLYPMLTSRYEPCFYTLYREILKGTIGEIKLINAQKSYVFGDRPEFFNNPDEYGNTFMWVGIHSVDLILWLTGSAVRESSYFASGKNGFGFDSLDDCAVAALRLENGVLATVTVDYLRDEDAETHGDDRIRVVGDKGILEVKDETLTLLKDGELEEIDLLPAPDIFLDIIKDIEGGGQSLADFESAFTSTEVVIDISKSNS